MQDLTHALLEYIDDRIGTMQTAPGSWGSTESLELQALLLLELRTFILRRGIYANDPFEARNLYIRFIRNHFPGAPASFMVDAAGDQADAMVPNLIGQLYRSFVERLPQESIFDTNKVALEVQFPDEYSEPLLVAVCEYVVRLQKTVAASITSHAAYKGYKLTFPMPDIRVAPANGKGPKVSMSLDAPMPVQQGLGDSFIPENAFVDALNTVLTTIDTVTSGVDAKRLAMSTLKRASAMIPGGDIQSVVIGGTSIPERATVSASDAHLFATLFDKDTTQVPFDEIGSVDILDFRQGWFHLDASSGSYRCWVVLSPDMMHKAKAAAPNGRLRVRGTARVPKKAASGRKPIVNVDVSDVVMIAPASPGAWALPGARTSRRAKS
jgi:hypothetical protein